MSAYRKIFPKRNTFLAVVHVENEEQALSNIDTAIRNGADGAFLINHSITATRLIGILRLMRKSFPNFWMGVNLLGVSPRRALELIPESTEGLWTDNAGICETGELPEAREFLVYRDRHTRWRGLYFGGVAFKYQTAVTDPAHVTKLALPFVDVVTTSGDRTGSAPGLEKVRMMKFAAGDRALAVASGMTPENVSPYKEYVDCFLVATGISTSHTELDPARVREFARVIAK
jgi:hypothetical protein